MFTKTLLTSAIVVVLSASMNLSADNNHHRNNFKFKPLDESANAADWNPAVPWKLPRGFKQRVISDESDLNIYKKGCDDWHDMNVVNETGPMAGRFMYRTHEVRLDSTPDNVCEELINEVGGAVSVVDLKTGESKILAQDPTYNALDGIRWTPWGSVVFAEETAGGRFLEIVLNDDMMTFDRVIDHPAVGRLAHEGIDFDTEGNLYVVDEHRGRTSGCDREGDGVTDIPCGGGVYKFVPLIEGDLSQGDLYVLGMAPTLNDEHRADNTGQGEWLGPIDPLNARAGIATIDGMPVDAASYQRPEDLEEIDGVLYVAVTEGPRDEYGKEYYEGRVIAVDLETMLVTNFVKAGVNVPVEIGKPGQEGHQTGFDSVDNLAEAPNGDLIMIEDNKPSDIWFASTKTDKFGASKDVDLFASLTDPGAEGTGIYFSPTDPKTLYVNVQHSEADDGDGTWAITRKGRGHWKRHWKTDRDD